MKILEFNSGALTNFEVLDLLRSRGAGKDPTRVIASVSLSEFKVFDYLEQTPACSQTRELVHKFVQESKKFDLAKAELVNIVNIRPSSDVEVFPIIEEHASIMNEGVEELTAIVAEVFPPHPSGADSNDNDQGKEEALDDQQAEPTN